MKKVACLILLFVILCSCKPYETTYSPKENIIGVWISCYELNAMLDTGEFKNEFTVMADRLAELGTSDAFIHVRAFGDSLFSSKYYPQNERVKQYDYDVLEYMINTLKEKGIRFHAWINPFRLSDGSFSDPGDESVRAKILSGIREIISAYDVDGIHFDDYFYPSGDSFSDEKTYSQYMNSGENTMSLAQYRIANVNSLIFSAKNAIKYINSDLVFSISPAADIKKNKEQAFADVSYWCESGAVDLIIPQLYFGFDYPDKNFGFENLLELWRKIPRADGVKLAIGLASYKIGTTAQPDTDEWINGTDILAREIKLCKEHPDISGVCFFSYSSLFSEDELHTSARNLIVKELLS